MGRKLINIILVIIIILGFIAVIVTQKIKISSITTEEISKYIPGSVIYAVMLILGLYCLKAVTFIIPMALLYISAGVILPPFWAIMFTFICLAAEMTIGFYIGRHMGRSRVMEKVAMNKKVSKLTGYVEDNSFLSCFVIRFVPGFPPDLVSMLLGTTSIKYFQFLSGSILGLMPIMIPIVLMGNSITSPWSREFLIPFAIITILSLSAIVVYRIWIKKHRGE